MRLIASGIEVGGKLREVLGFCIARSGTVEDPLQSREESPATPSTLSRPCLDASHASVRQHVEHDVRAHATPSRSSAVALPTTSSHTAFASPRRPPYSTRRPCIIRTFHSPMIALDTSRNVVLVLLSLLPLLSLGEWSTTHHSTMALSSRAFLRLRGGASGHGASVRGLEGEGTPAGTSQQTPRHRTPTPFLRPRPPRGTLPSSAQCAHPDPLSQRRPLQWVGAARTSWPGWNGG